MLHFFRRLRKRFLSQNQTARYLKYAIGEIVLVVIGILIALQINNWNEEKKQFAYEGKILKEIYRGLQTDSARIVRWIKPRVNRSLAAADALIEHIHNDQYPGDSLFRVQFNQVQASGYVSLNFGPYEALKSNGLDKVKNEGLRFKLVDVFESVLPRQLQFIQSRDESQKEFRMDIRRKLRKLTTYINTKNTPRIGYNVNKQTFKDYQFLQLIWAERGVASTMGHRSDVILESIGLTLTELRAHFEAKNIDYEKTFQVDALGVRSQLSDSLYVRSPVR